MNTWRDIFLSILGGLLIGGGLAGLLIASNNKTVNKEKENISKQVVVNGDTLTTVGYSCSTNSAYILSNGLRLDVDLYSKYKK